MSTLTRDLSAEFFHDIYIRLWSCGKQCSPRGMKVVEVENFMYNLPPYVRFTNFSSRNMNLSYLKREFLWYLRGDQFDLSICDHAQIWKNIVTPQGLINSNYGHYIFNLGGFDWVVEELSQDKDSRRASITILNRSHLVPGNKDVPCTYSLNFRIRDNELNMTVHMRSQDAIFGMTNDAACFSLIHEMMYVTMRETYPELQYGIYTHVVDSFHVYERHFGMMEKLAKGDDYVSVNCPKISSKAEVDFLKSGKAGLEPAPAEFAFTHWLTQL